MANDFEKGRVQLTGLPETECFSSLKQFAEYLVANILISIPDGVGSGVHVGISAPEDAAVTGIWVKIDNGGTFIGMYVFSNAQWIQIDLGGCTLDAVFSGAVLTCVDGASQPLTGDSEGKVLTLIDAATGEAEYQALSNPIGSSASSNTLGTFTLSNTVGFTVFDTSNIGALLFNASPIFSKKFNLNVVMDIKGISFVTATEYTILKFELQQNVNGGAFTTIATVEDQLYLGPGAGVNFDRQVVANIPWNGSSSVAPLGAENISFRGRITLVYAGSSGLNTYEITESGISYTAMGYNI